MTQYRRQLDGSGCCDNWKNGIRTINGQYPDDNRDFDVNAGDGIEITPATAGITIAVKTPFPGPMIFRGTVGTGGTIATLPTANADNLGWTYVAITAGSTPDSTPKSYDVGDTLVSNGLEWIVIPSGDDPVDWSQIQNKPTTVSGYGITDAVDTSSDQTVGGNKTFSGSTVFTHNSVSIKSSGVAKYLNFYKPDNTLVAMIEAHDNGILTLQGGSGGTRVNNQRVYNASNTNDVVTIGTLQASSDVVHTTGNETITGSKTFNSKILGQIEKADKVVSSDGTCEIGVGNNGSMSLKDSSLSLMSSAIFMEETATQGSTVLQTYLTGDNWTGLYVKLNTSNTATLQLIKIISGVATVNTIVTL